MQIPFVDKNGAFELTVKIDYLDYDAVLRVIRKRWNLGREEMGDATLPDAVHDDACEVGRVIAEICRGWEEYHESY